MFQHDCLDTCCLRVLYACVLYFCICTCSTQMTMFHMERRSRNTLIIIIIIINPSETRCTIAHEVVIITFRETGTRRTVVVVIVCCFLSVPATC